MHRRGAQLQLKARLGRASWEAAFQLTTEEQSAGKGNISVKVSELDPGCSLPESPVKPQLDVDQVRGQEPWDKEGRGLPVMRSLSIPTDGFTAGRRDAGVPCA